VSEGRDEEVLGALRAAFSGPARLLDVHVDADHHRSVYTIVGSEAELIDTLVAGIACAAARVDLTRHVGAHPRIGAADVVPIVPLEPAAEPAARSTALALAERVATELRLPVFYYGALTDDRREPAYFRHGGPVELQRRLDAGELSPDLGPRRLHPTAGGVIVGVRRPLIAFNVNLATADLQVARAIARTVRERDGGLRGVRALGLELPSAGMVQVSMNITDWEAVAPHEVVARITEEAAARGVEVAESELVGLMPAGPVVAAARGPLGLRDFDRRGVLELRLLDDALNGDVSAA
jgi:glutamate formiminotransferase